MASTKPFARTGTTGAAGELAFRAQVLARGHNVWLPQVDDGVDLLVNSLRVQVKTAVERPKKGRGESLVMGYTFSKVDTLAEDVDVLALVGIGQRWDFRYWIIPVSVLPLPRASTAWLCSSRDRRFGGGKSAWEPARKYEDAWHVLEAE